MATRLFLPVFSAPVLASTNDGRLCQYRRPIDASFIEYRAGRRLVMNCGRVRPGVEEHPAMMSDRNDKCKALTIQRFYSSGKLPRHDVSQKLSQIPFIINRPFGVFRVVDDERNRGERCSPTFRRRAPNPSTIMS